MRPLIFSLLITLISSQVFYSPEELKPQLKLFHSFSNISMFLSGFFEALHSDDVAKGFVSCGSFLDEANEDRKQIPELFKTHNGTLAFEIIEEDLLGLFSNCIGSLATPLNITLRKIAEIIEDPQFPTLLEQRLYNHFLDLLQEVINGIQTLKQGKYLEAGSNFGSFAYLLLSGNVSSVATNFLHFEEENSIKTSNSSVPDALEQMRNSLEIIEGFLYSVFRVKSNVPDLFPCLNHISSWKTTIQQVIIELREGFVVKALIEIAQALNETENLCLSSKEELEDITQKMKKFAKSPFLLQFIRARIKDNVDEMIDYWYSAVDNLKNGEFFSAGEAFGKIPQIIWSGPNNTMVNVNYSE